MHRELNFVFTYKNPIFENKKIRKWGLFFYHSITHTSIFHWQPYPSKLISNYNATIRNQRN